jgi:hypothetical protein
MLEHGKLHPRPGGLVLDPTKEFRDEDPAFQYLVLAEV